MNKNLKLDDFLKEMLQDKRLAAMYLEECLADGNIDFFKKALKDVADAQPPRKDTK
jgi:DNA-binding phage protein